MYIWCWGVYIHLIVTGMETLWAPAQHGHKNVGSWKDSGMKPLLWGDRICDKAKHSLASLSICCSLCCTGSFPLCSHFKGLMLLKFNPFYDTHSQRGALKTLLKRVLRNSSSLTSLLRDPACCPYLFIFNLFQLCHACKAGGAERAKNPSESFPWSIWAVPGWFWAGSKSLFLCFPWRFQHGEGWEDGCGCLRGVGWVIVTIVPGTMQEQSHRVTAVPPKAFRPTLPKAFKNKEKKWKKELG